MTDTMKAAILRGIYNALGMFGATFLTTLLTTDNMRDALIVGGISAFAVLGFRAGGEGFYDSARDQRGDVKPGDVGYVDPRHTV